MLADILGGETAGTRIPNDDLQYVEDLGLIVRRPHVHIANRIYQEVIPRELTASTQHRLPYQTSGYIRPDGHLDMPKLLTAFQQFFREHSQSWLDGHEHPEAGPQLLMQAFLQRMVNGGGRISREYGLGRQRTDLLVEWPLDKTRGYAGPLQKVVIELKLLRRELDATLSQGLEQTADYADTCGASEAYLLLFDRRAGKSREKHIWQRTENHAGRHIGIWGM